MSRSDRRKWFTRVLAGLAFLSVTTVKIATAQISTPTEIGPGKSPVATLEQQLINQLRATTEDRQAYVRLVVDLVTNEQIELRYVQAIARYAVRKNPQFPFPYFERAMRFEAEKRGIDLPPVRLLAGSIETYRVR